MSVNPKPKILGIACSGRRLSNSGKLLDYALRSAQSVGADTQYIWLGDYSYSGCTGCLLCVKDGKCPIRDDMQKLYPIVDEADAVIIATPVYFYGLPGYAKCFVDRFQAYWERARRWSASYTHPSPPHTRLGISTPKKKVGGLIAIGGSGGKRLFDGIQLSLKYFFEVIDSSDEEPLLIRNYDKTPALLSAKTLKKASEYGGKIAKLTMEE